METIDPTTGEALPPDAIQRVLFVAPLVHVYQIPPMSSTKGHSAATWTTDGENGASGKEIFTARARIVETSLDDGDDDGDDDNNNNTAQQLKVDVVLEDRATGQLFAAAPYTSPGAVESVIDSARFFALTVRDPEGRKAVLGIGFEERSEAFDFGVALQEARRALGWEAAAAAGQGSAAASGGVGSSTKNEKKDYSLKEGETITVNLGGTKFGRKARETSAPSPSEAVPSTGGLSAFSLPPPPSGPLLPPPPAAAGVREKKRLSQSAEQLGFDDGKFGEFA